MIAEQYPIDPIKIRATDAAYEAANFIASLFVRRAAGEAIDDDEGTCIIPAKEATRKTNREAMENAINHFRLTREVCAAQEDDIELPEDS